MERIGLTPFRVIPAEGEEVKDPALTPAELVEGLSAQKAAEVAARAGGSALVIGADTVVVLDGQVLGKPRDEADAFAMLSALAGRSHEVFTGVTVTAGGRTLSRHQRTLVRFRPLTSAEIRRYIATGEPMDKAGAYGIQEKGALLVEGIEGDYFNVMGLPVCLLGEMLLEFGVAVL